MEKKILLGLHERLSIKGTKKLYLFAGGIFLLNGVFHLFAEDYRIASVIIGISMVFAAGFYFFLGITALSEKSKYAPHFEVTDQMIRFKKKPFKPATEIFWKDVRSLSFDSYQLTFNFDDTQKVCSYISSPEISVEIKKAVREFADKKGIEVIGG